MENRSWKDMVAEGKDIADKLDSYRERMPKPYDEDRRYGSDERARLDGDACLIQYAAMMLRAQAAAVTVPPLDPTLLDLAEKATKNRNITLTDAQLTIAGYALAGEPVPWIGCGECDSSFTCAEGRGSCIRHVEHPTSEPSALERLVAYSMVSDHFMECETLTSEDAYSSSLELLHNVLKCSEIDIANIRVDVILKLANI